MSNRKAAFRLSLNELMNEEAEDGTYNKQEIKNKLLAGNFTLAEIDTMLVSLMADNSIFMTDDTIMRI
ncbi:hypothetical protein SARC_11467 [Sphaeroforma arctica JP610]|uniref:MCM3-like winged helix domain-containing protein n=1 Tax=Sphaeroforma arctica JP610 TaxID=667725 RepID=A0A0L0FJ21_9EUKA|nr:hypothetical protein SARC_11467 [Sphaeroforma arctica JP610]KNC76023.1 hypothetical protein SARC_11467 [Sphaeroforma arctica JP610]|eukprot:XP_014149925.1 hypothetical protein SARC_11467 [Sphaeroforma arctica JP610]